MSGYAKKVARMTDRKRNIQLVFVEALLAPLLAKQKILLAEQARIQAGGVRVSRARRRSVSDPRGLDCLRCSEPYDPDDIG